VKPGAQAHVPDAEQKPVLAQEGLHATDWRDERVKELEILDGGSWEKSGMGSQMVRREEEDVREMNVFGDNRRDRGVNAADEDDV